MRWYGHVLRMDNGNNLRKALDFEVAGRRGRGLPNLTWKRQVWEHISQIELKREDGIDRVKWCNGVYELPRSTRSIRSPAFTQTKPDLKNWISLSHCLCKKPTYSFTSLTQTLLSRISVNSNHDREKKMEKHSKIEKRKCLKI